MNPDDRDRIWNEREQRWGQRYDRHADSFTRHPVLYVLKWVALIFAVVLVVGACSAATGLIGNYAHEAKRTVDVPNNREQTTAILEDEEGMKVAAANVCDVQAAGEGKHSADDPQLIENPTIAYRATYRRMEADYNRRMRNFFEARNDRHVPIPGNIGNLPEVAPTLTQRLSEVC